jgi:ankyrin repeat protein
MKIPFVSKFFELSNEDSLKLISSKDTWASIKLGVASFFGLINPNKIEQNQSLLDLAISKGNPTSIEWLAKQGVDLNAKNSELQTGLMTAVYQDKTDILRALLANGADPNMQGYIGRTALHAAVAKENPSMVAILLDKGADPNIKNEYGNTPLELNIIGTKDAATKEILVANHAAITLKDEIAKYEKQHGEIKLNKGIVKLDDDLKNTNLHRALERGYTQLAKSILRNENNLENINLQNVQGLTALHIAVQKGNKDIVEILLEKKADLNIKDHQGKTPLDYADDKQIHKLLRPKIIKLGEGQYQVLGGSTIIGGHRNWEIKKPIKSAQQNNQQKGKKTTSRAL